MEKFDPSYIIGETVKWHRLCEKQFGKYMTTTPLLGMYPKELKTGIQTNACTHKFTAALFTTTQRWKQPKCP